MVKNMLTNKKETKRALEAAVDQANKVLRLNTRTHCAGCGGTPKTDEWSAHNKNYCFDCG